jgi:hypothetical protein
MSKKNKTLKLTAKLWNSFRLLKEIHEDDTRDFRFHIHAIQNIIMSRTDLKKELKKK